MTPDKYGRITKRERIGLAKDRLEQARRGTVDRDFAIRLASEILSPNEIATCLGESEEVIKRQLAS